MWNISTRKNIPQGIFLRVIAPLEEECYTSNIELCIEVRPMLRRKIQPKLEEWKAKKKGKCLIIAGARQVGKTFIVRQFANEKYSSFENASFDHEEIHFFGQ